ncbi:MAG: SpoIID/LytB domain-containing protein [Bacteroidales bacterium]|nr:SpoIID/LytB domain-containing protein [Bacteroidales bacterium]
MKPQERLTVGIFSSPEIAFELLKPCGFGGREYCGPQKALFSNGRILFDGGEYEELLFAAPERGEGFSDAVFALAGVTIGVDFHWERQETQRFAGSLRIIVENGRLTAINVIGIEDYLRSVISSEMKSSAPQEFLKAHAVISRSWLLAQIRKKEKSLPRPEPKIREGRLIRWFDREDHLNFDVCADDHCQRYQGLSRVAAEAVDKVVEATWGEVLTYGGKICDARFSKCCGGVTEIFSSCWEDIDYPYLRSVADAPSEGADPFCKTRDRRLLSHVLNDYDLETLDFFDWKVEYTRSELSELICRRSGIDFGQVRELIPLRRGPSGRIVELEIVGSKRSLTVGKELMIRRWLSESHLKSSAFTISYDDDRIILTGRGWGHGVGLCQIGAAVMGEKGYDYSEILSHYFPGSVLEKEY